MKKLTLIMILGAAIGLGASIHDNAGEYGYQFLNLPANPVALALAGRGIHGGQDLASFLSQPASGALESHRSLGASHTAWLEDTKFNNVYYSYSNRRTHFGLVLRNLDYGEIENRDDAGNLIGYYTPLNLSLTVNYAARINPSLYLGLNAGAVYEKLNTDSSVGFHTDLGLSYLPPVSNTVLSLAVRNLGLSSAMNEEATKLPLSFEADLSKSFDLNNKALTLEASLVKAIDDNFKGCFSAELRMFGLLALRGGYKLNYDEENISAGLGLRWQHFAVDYGYSPFGSRLSDVHSLGLSYHF
jgi:hypothetical protein